MPPINVEKLAQEADELHRKMYPEQYGDPPTPPDPGPGTPPPAAPEPPKDQSAPPEPAPEGAGEPPGAPQDGTPPEPPATPSPEPPAPGTAPPQAPDTNWEGRYNALKGKYDAEVPRLAAEVAILKQKLAELPQPATPTAPTPPAPATKVSMTDVINKNPELKEQFETFSVDYPDVARLMTSLMEAATEASVQKVNERVEQVQGSIKNVEQVAIESKVNAFWNVVNSKMPDWETTKNDPEFAIYLNETDPFSGLQRGLFVQDAIGKLDAHRVLAIYSDFRNSKKKPSNSSATPPSTPNTNTPAPKPADALVAPPSGNRPAAPSNIPADQPITAAFIQKFYNDAALGKYRGKDKEFAALEAKINKAVAEGKVV